MVNLKIKPLSVNKAWAGRRFKTPEYKKYQRDVLYLLPKLKLPEAPYEVKIIFGFSSAGSDIDNPVKPIMDILQKKYGFNDNQVYRMVLEKEQVKKGSEFIKFEIKRFGD